MKSQGGSGYNRFITARQRKASQLSHPQEACCKRQSRKNGLQTGRIKRNVIGQQLKDDSNQFPCKVT